MKKLLSLLLSLALILTLTACGNTPDTPTAEGVDVSTTTATDIVSPTEDTTTAAPVIETVTDASGKPITQPDGKPVTTIVTTTGKPVTVTVTNAHGKPVTKPDGKPVTSVITTRPTAGSGFASASNPTYPGKSTNKTTIPTSAQNVVTEEQKTVDRLFTLGTGQSESGITLTGVVTYVKEVSSTHGNATFDLQVQGVSGSRTLFCYRVTPIDITQLQVQEGQTLILTGTVQNYKGTIEFYPATYQIKGGTVITTKPTTAPTGSSGAIDRNGIYDSKNEVALYIHTYGCLPKNYITKSQYKSQGKPRDKCCGGDRFYNNEGLLPSGYTYYECDIDTLGTTNRGTKRIVWTTSGIVYYTSDHYASFTKLYGER